ACRTARPCPPGRTLSRAGRRPEPCSRKPPTYPTGTPAAAPNNSDVMIDHAPLDAQTALEPRGPRAALAPAHAVAAERALMHVAEMREIEQIVVDQLVIGVISELAGQR